MQCGARVHRVRRRWCSARHHYELPHCQPDGQRGGDCSAVRVVWLEGGRYLCDCWTSAGRCRRLGHRPVAARTACGAVRIRDHVARSTSRPVDRVELGGSVRNGSRGSRLHHSEDLALPGHRDRYWVRHSRLGAGRLLRRCRRSGKPAGRAGGGRHRRALVLQRGWGAPAGRGPARQGFGNGGLCWRS